MNLTEPSGRLNRWQLLISEFGYHVQCIKYSRHFLADCMSRIPVSAEAIVEVDQDICCLPLSVRALRKTPRTTS